MQEDSIVLKEGLEIMLNALEDEWRRNIGAPILPLACAFCYNLIAVCRCPIPSAWPIPLVLIKLRDEIGA